LISSDHPLHPRELTVQAVVLGILIGGVMTMANVYLGLFAGMTVSASIPAAVISMGVLRGLMKRGSILENNIVQTIASAGESLAAGIIFTMPALVIAGVWTDFDYWTTTLVSMTGGMLGVLFMIPLRRPMIVENRELTYPEGVACARVLEAGDRGGSAVKQVFGYLGLGVLVKACADGLGLIAGELHGAWIIGKSKLFLGLTVSPALIGVGWIVGFNIAALVFVGGSISWLAAAPWLTATKDYGISLEDPGILGLVNQDVRFLGVGAMIVGGLWSILQIRKGIRAGLKATFGGYKAAMQGKEPPPRTDQDMDQRWLMLLILATTIIVLFLYFRVTGLWGESLLATGLMVVCSFFFVAVASYIVGLVGSSNSPVSGMTIVSVLLTSAVIAAFGFSGSAAILATMGVAGVVCCATCSSGDVCQDLKTGSLVGATPYRQQWAEVIGVVTASFLMAPVLRLLHATKGIGTDVHLPEALQGHALSAPQANLFASLMSGFFGDTQLPWDLIGAGAAVGIAIIVLDQMVLLPRRSKFRLFVMPTAVGMYLPFGLSVAMLLGGLASWWATRKEGSEEARDARHERGILQCSGLIAGEAIAGVLLAIPVALGLVLPLWSHAWMQLSGALLLLAVLLLLMRRPAPAHA